ncbi:MAG: LPP20 family lipoprotein [Treponema sp.]|jgi:hypothetical protein|nr:LPP20 family lipoprotein [Treponema sp.]
MKKIFFVCFAVLLTSGILGAQTLPSWLNETPPSDVLWGIGSAKQANRSFAQTLAEGRARQSISFALNSSIKSAITDHNREATVNGVTVSTGLQESITRILTESQLNGTQVSKVWFASDGTAWVRIEYSKELAKRWTREVLKEQIESAGEKVDQDKLASINDDNLNKISQTAGLPL